MKLFQQLLVAPAALGLMAPMAANAADLNIQGVSDYTASGEQVTSISQFQDVYPTDWAYQALSNLIERYGCVAGYPSGSYLGNRAMTRYEAAALLNACLDRITEVTDETRRLLNEFEQELAVIKGRVDGLEARVGTLEAQQFSTTTKLVGQASMVVGANKFSSSEDDFADEGNALAGATVFNYDLRLNLNTSFTGDDLLRTRLRVGNFQNSSFGSTLIESVDTSWGSAPLVLGGLNALEVGSSTFDIVTVDRLYYQFPVGDDFTVTAGALVRQDDMLAVWPSLYPAETALDIFTYAGAPGAYSLTNGGGAGLKWDSDNGFAASASYVSGNAADGNPNTGGIGTDGAASNTTAQIAYSADQWGIAGAYSYTSGDNGAGLYAGNATPFANAANALGTTNSFGVSAWWQPEDTGFIPSVSTGWGLNSVSPNDQNDDEFDSVTSQSWYVGLMWDDAFVEGNTLGLAVGQPTFVTNVEVDDDSDASDFVADGNYAWETWYKFQVTDNISVTPVVFYLSRPLGNATTEIDGADSDTTFKNWGGLVRTTFKF